MSCAALNAPQSFCAAVAAASSRFLGAGAQRQRAPMGTASAGSSARAAALGNGQRPRRRAGQGAVSTRLPHAPVAEPWLVPVALRSPGGMDAVALSSVRDADGDRSVNEIKARSDGSSGLID